MAKKKLNITAAALRRAADSRSYKKDEDCFKRGLVRSLLADGDEIAAKVSGTRDYRVSLRVEDGKIGGECSCPMGDMGAFCKHMVAVGLAEGSCGGALSATTRCWEGASIAATVGARYSLKSPFPRRAPPE